MQKKKKKKKKENKAKNYRLVESGYDMEGFIFATNITPEALLKTNVDNVLKIVKDYNIDPEVVEFELVEDYQVCDKGIKVLNDLRKLKFRVAIDDFSAGHSSLKYISKINPDTLKLDRSLIPEMNNEKEKLIYSYIANLCKELNIVTVAEGVETKTEVEFMKKLEIDQIQGFYYYKALSEDEFINAIVNGINK